MKDFLILYKVHATTTMASTTTETTAVTTMDTPWVSTTSQEFTTVTPDASSGAFSRNPLAREDDFGDDFVEGSSIDTTLYPTQTSTAGTGSSGTGSSGTDATGTAGISGAGFTETAATWASTETTAASSASSFTISSSFAQSTGTSLSAGDNTGMAVSSETASTIDSKTSSATTSKESKEDFTSTTSTIAPSPPKAQPRDDVISDNKFNLSGTTLSGIDSEIETTMEVETTAYFTVTTTEHASLSVTYTQPSTDISGETTEYKSSATTTMGTTQGITTTTTDSTNAPVEVLPGVNVEPIPAPDQAEDEFETPPTSPQTATSHSVRNEKVTLVNDKATNKPDEELNIVTATKPLYVCTTGASDYDDDDDGDDCEENVIAEVEDKASEFDEVNRKCKFHRSMNSH